MRSQQPPRGCRRCRAGRRRRGCARAVPPARARPRRIGAAMRVGRRRRRERQADDELAALADAGAARGDRGRRASRPAGAPATGRCRGRPASGRAPPATWPNISKMPRQLRGGDADAGVAHRTTASLPSRSTASAIRPPRGRVLGGVDQQVGEHLRQPRQVAVDRRSRSAGRASVERVAGGVDRRLRDLDRLLDHASPAQALAAQLRAGRVPCARRRAGRRAGATSAPPGARSRRGTTRPGHRSASLLAQHAGPRC